MCCSRYQLCSLPSGDIKAVLCTVPNHTCSRDVCILDETQHPDMLLMLSAPTDLLIHPSGVTFFVNVHTTHRPLRASLELFPAPLIKQPEQHKETHTKISGEDFLLQKVLVNRNFCSFRIDAISVLQNQRLIQMIMLLFTNGKRLLVQDNV